MANDPHGLNRFVVAQEGDYDRALAEIVSGRKRSHWMWYVFPQYDGLGFSAMSARYAIKSVAEASAYLSHPVLGPRLLKNFGMKLMPLSRSPSYRRERMMPGTSEAGAGVS